jgi:hypothetical protein
VDCCLPKYPYWIAPNQEALDFYFPENTSHSEDVIRDEYIRLLEKGELSLTPALEVGVEIEEMDIGDIERMLGETVKADIERVIESLQAGSNNHLDAFSTQL